MKIYSVGIAMIAICVSLNAQDTPRPFQVGVSTVLSASVNVVPPPKGWQVQPRLHAIPDMYVTTMVPVWQQMGLAVGLDMGLTSSGVRCSSVITSGGAHELDMRYATIVPSIAIGSLTVGCGIHLPLSGRMVTQDGTQSNETITVGLNDVTVRSLMGTVIDLRAGAEFPFIEDDAGVVSGVVSCSYQVASMFLSPDVSGSVVYGLNGVQSAYDPAMFHLRAGLRYLFSFAGGTGTSAAPELPLLEELHP